MPKRERKFPEPLPTADNPAQSRAFVRKAREVEVHESPGTINRAFARVTDRLEKSGEVADSERPPERKTNWDPFRYYIRGWIWHV